MNRSEFRRYRRQFAAEFRRLLAEWSPGSLDEQAVPSYTHPNFLMSWLFWERIRVVINQLEKVPPVRALDFGCGTGVIFPALRKLKTKIFACDVDLTAAKHIAEQQGWNNIDWVQGVDRLQELDAGMFDTIICLDVLEHVESLGNVTRELARLLCPGGRIIISGPTESRLYRLGRWLAGFSGCYHVRTIYDIERHLSDLFDLHLLKRLIWPATLFRISDGNLLSVSEMFRFNNEVIVK